MKNHFLLIISLIFISFIGFNCHDNRNIILKDDIRGIIDTIFQDKNNHKVYTFGVNDDKNDSFFIADFYPKSWKYASIGDSIIKKEGESFITIKKRDGSLKTFETRVKK